MGLFDFWGSVSRQEYQKIQKELKEKQSELEKTNDALEKYATLSQNNEPSDDIIETTAGLAQVEGKVENPEYTATTSNTQTIAYKEVETADVETKKKKRFGKNK